MSTPGGGGDGGTDNGPVDMAHSASPHDLSTVPTTHDLSQLPNTMTGCLGLLMCENNCPATDMTCPTTCQNNATPQGNSLFQSLLNCVVQACPGSVPGDPCYNTSSTACSNCLNQAQMTSGACETQVSACDNNTP